MEEFHGCEQKYQNLEYRVQLKNWEPELTKGRDAVIDRLPRCLHTCLNCKNAVLYEEYRGPSRKIIFEGCWKMNGIKTPVDRENCEKFEESTDRVKRSFWKKWEGCIYIAEGDSPGSGQRCAVNYESFRTADNLVCEDSGSTQYHAGEEHKLKDLPTIDELPFIQGLPAADELSTTEEYGPPAEECELINEECETIEKDELIAELDEDTAKECEDDIEGCEDPVENQKVPAGHDPIDSKGPTHRVSKQKESSKQKYTTTRSLILQALSNGISRLKDIAYFADVDPSTAHYHLRNLVKEYRVTKVSWGEYIFSDQSLDSDGKFLNESGRTFEKLLKNFSHPGRGWCRFEGLHPLERNILMDILSKENKYEKFSERELARRSNISRYAVKKYTENLEKNKLITIKRENNQLVFAPTEVAIKGLTDFFNSVQTGSKIDSSSSKIQPLYQPGDNSMVVNEDNSSQDVPLEPANMVRESPGVYTPSENILETFDDYLVWQQKNAHRMIIQFKLLRCSHPRLKGTGWIFGQKSIHRHFAEAYIFKSKDPKGEFVNILPRNPFIFMSPFEFEDQIITFVNEVIDVLRDHGMIIDLSEPAEIKLQHEAIEDDPFARKVIEKGLLYFESKVLTVDSTGKLMKYVIKIDKSKSLHLEFEGSEAHHLTENLEAFVDDVVTGRIDRKKLREIPHKVEKIKKELVNEIDNIEERLNKSIQHIEDTQKLLHQNQSDITENLVACMEIVRKIGEASESVARATHTIMKEVQFLAAETQEEFDKCSYLSHCS